MMISEALRNPLSLFDVKIARTQAVRADRSLHTDEKPSVCKLRSCNKTTQAVLAFNQNRALDTDAFYPYQEHGWRAQRAGLLFVARDGIYATVNTKPIG
jgi:hypothetical protein